MTEEEYLLFEGRPENLECTEMEMKVYDLLDSLNIKYKTLKHPVAFTMQECQRVRDRINAPVAKNLFLTNKQQNQFYLLLMPADKIFKTKYLSAQINSARLSFANENHMNKYLGVKPGSVSPMGLINDSEGKVKLLIDSDLKKEVLFACHPCINSASIVMSFHEFIDTFLPAVDHETTWVTLPGE